MLLSHLVAAFSFLLPQTSLRSDFESDAPGEVPSGWTLPTSSATSYGAEVVEDEPHGGKRCVRIHKRVGGEAPFGNLRRTIDAKPYRGRRVALRAALRAAKGGQVQMWLRVDRENDVTGFFDNMGDRPVLRTGWQQVEIVGTIDADAESLSLGVMLIGEGEAFVDDLVLEILGDAPPPEPARPLSERGLANLEALARLYGHVRHFHPSDEVAAADWNALAVHGVRVVESAADARELASALATTFAPVAPTLRVFAAGDAEPQPAPELSSPPDEPRVYVRSWAHTGFGQGGRSIYQSARTRTRLREGQLPADVRDPADTLRVECPGGVVALVPLALYATSAHTLPVATTAAPAALLAPSGDDRATRLASVMIAWNVLQHFYPYFDVVGTEWDDELPRALKAAATDADARAFLDTLRRLVAALKDGHGAVMHGSDRRFAMLPFAWDWVEGALVVTHVPPELEAPVRPGDAVRSIDGRAVGELRAELGALISAATPQWIDWQLLRELGRGTPGEVRALEIERLDGTTERVSVELIAPRASLDMPRPEPVAELEAGIWYVDIQRIGDADFERALPDLAAGQVIVFDFRGYPGGISPQTYLPHLLDSPAKSPQWHTPILSMPGRENMEFRTSNWNLVPEEPRLPERRAFLIDGRAISQAESCLGIVEHYKLGELIGSPTAGTNGNVNPLTLPGGYSVSWTGMKVLKQDGSPHHGVGILPTIPVARTRAGVAAGRDEVLERAVDAVRPN